MSKRHAGSVTFGTNIVKTDEYILLAETMVENGSSIQQAALEIEAIDDMLRIHRMELIINYNRFTKTGRMRKNVSLLDLLDGRVNNLIDDLKTQNNENI